MSTELIERKTEIQPYLQKYGGIDKCLCLIENEKRPVKLSKIVNAIDHEFGAESSMDLKTYMTIASKYEDEKTLVTLAGYSHLILAERMVEKKYSKRDINFELDKACALLDLANRGGNHPYLPRAMKLKRKINCASYTKLIIAIIIFLIIVLIIAALSRFIIENQEIFI